MNIAESLIKGTYTSIAFLRRVHAGLGWASRLLGRVLSVRCRLAIALWSFLLGIGASGVLSLASIMGLLAVCVVCRGSILTVGLLLGVVYILGLVGLLVMLGRILLLLATAIVAGCGATLLLVALVIRGLVVALARLLLIVVVLVLAVSAAVLASGWRSLVAAHVRIGEMTIGWCSSHSRFISTRMVYVRGINRKDCRIRRIQKGVIASKLRSARTSGRSS